MKKEKVEFEINSDLEDELDAEEDEEEEKKNALSRRDVAVLRGKFDVDAERTVFVGNIPVDATSKEISRLFAKFGSVESVRFRSAVGRKSKQPKRVAVIRREEFHPEIDRINAFVKFKDAETAKEALSLNNFLLREHHLRVDSCQQRGGRHGSSSSGGSNEHQHENCIFIGNLPFACNEEKLRAHFALKEGENENDGVVYVRIIRDRYSGLGKGFGYIRFATKEGVEHAIETKDGSKFEGRKLRVTQSNANPVAAESGRLEKKANMKKKKHEKGLTKEQRAEKSMLRRKWYFKAGTSASAGKSSEQIAKFVKEGNDRVQPKKKRRFPQRGRKFKPTNAK